MITTTSQKLHDGARNVVMQFTGISDGGVGDQETNVVKVDVSLLLPVPTSVKLLLATYEVVGGLVQLLWDADDPVPFLNLASVNEIDYRKIGGLVNPVGPTGSGNILFSTMGFDAGSSYSIKLEMVKRF